MENKENRHSNFTDKEKIEVKAVEEQLQKRQGISILVMFVPFIITLLFYFLSGVPLALVFGIISFVIYGVWCKWYIGELRDKISEAEKNDKIRQEERVRFRERERLETEKQTREEIYKQAYEDAKKDLEKSNTDK